jgi:hypothetical protein
MPPARQDADEWASAAGVGSGYLGITLKMDAADRSEAAGVYETPRVRI